MNSFVHADIFFFLTSIAVVVFTIVVAILGVMLIQTIASLRELVLRVKRDADAVLDIAESVTSAVSSKAGGVAGALGVLGTRLWKAQQSRTASKRGKKRSK